MHLKKRQRMSKQKTIGNYLPFHQTIPNAPKVRINGKTYQNIDITS